MNDAAGEVPRELAQWLVAPANPPEDWAPDPPIDELRCHPDLVERLATLVRPLRGVRRAFVVGCPVIHAANGVAFATAFGTSGLLARVRDVEPQLVPEHALALPRGWCAVDPWPSDVAFARGVDTLRRLFERAHREALAA